MNGVYDDEPEVEEPVMLCFYCAGIITDTEVVDKTGEPFCTWDHLYRFEDEGIPVD